MAVSSRRGLTTGDSLIGLACAMVVLALAYPTLRARSFRAGVDTMVADVDSMRRGAEDHLRTNGRWPASGAPGIIPPELTGFFAGDTNRPRDRYALQWTRWEVVEYVEAPPSAQPLANDALPDAVEPARLPVVREVGGIVLHTGDEALLAELLSRYRESSFVRDTTWTLLLHRAVAR